jgi:prophage regulatory protein
VSKSTSQTPNELADRILRLPEVIRMTGVCRSTILVWAQVGRFPKKVTLGPRCVGWSERAVRGWIATRLASSGTQGI